MAHHSISRLLLSVQKSPPSPIVTAEPPVPVYSDMVIILICLLCAIICVVGLMALARWKCLNHPSSATEATTDEVVPGKCLKKKIVDALPRLIFKPAAGVTQDASASAAECVICLTEFVDGDVIRVLPRCGHVFHVGCIDKWLIESRSFCCPSCRQALVVSHCQTCSTDISVISLPPPQAEANFLP